MGFSEMSFNPSNGLRDATYDTVPVSEDAAREQIQGRLDEIKSHINNDLNSELESIVPGQSGAERIGSAAINGITYVDNELVEQSAVTVHMQIKRLKEQLTQAVTEGFGEGDITSSMIANAAIDSTKLAQNAVETSHIKDYQVNNVKLAEDSVSSDKIQTESIGTEHIRDDAVTSSKIIDGAVSAGKIGANAVTAAQIADSAVTSAKINSAAKTNNINITSSTVLATATAVKTAYDKGQAAYTLAQSKESALDLDQKRKITYGTASPSGGSSGDIYIKYS